MANKHMKRWSTVYIVREIQIETTVRYHYTSIRMAKIWNTDNPKCWQECGAKETLIHCWWECKMVQPLWKTVGLFPTNWTCSHHTFQQSCSLLFTQKSWELMSTQKPVHTHIYSSTIHNCQNLGTTMMSFSRWMNEWTVVHPGNGILYRF